MTVYRLKPEDVKKGLDEIGIEPEKLDSAETQLNILQCAYLLVLKPAIKDSYELVVKGKPVAESGIDRILENIL